MTDDDLIFHLLRGLTKVFNGFKTVVCTRGTSVTFDEAVTMLNSEDIQLLQDTSSETDTSTVLLATHGNGSVSNVIPQLNTQTQNQGVPMHVPVISVASSQQGSSQSQYSSSQQQQYSFMPQQQQYSQSYRNSSRGRGGYRGRYPRDPCAICGRNNHVTEFCYYKGQLSQNQPCATTPVLQGYSPQGISGYYPQMQGYAPQGFYSQGNVGYPQGNLVFSQGNFPGFPSYTFGPQGNFSSVPGTPSYIGIPGLPVSTQPSQPSSQTPAQAHFTGYTGAYNLPSQYTIPSGSPSGIVFTGSQMSATTNPTTAPQWYLDSGATQHITNNLQNLQLAQPTTQSEGIVVGNGSQLPVTHTGQEFPYTTLVTSTTPTPSVAPSFPISLTSFNDIQISVLPKTVSQSPVIIPSNFSEVQHTELTSESGSLHPASRSLSSISHQESPLLSSIPLTNHHPMGLLDSDFLQGWPDGGAIPLAI
ncbi:hypothetical protein Vadar_020555 [Vaccinium darrowii]|uniref:Uncharacterized protein n=1 Tax=Vaccinium darrowii TaxID=229202 RepID=A0ACB7Y0X1_9ERIC|nr:hypothetical protein Vadar_020555 [Vaccinium darrowii]